MNKPRIRLPDTIKAGDIIEVKTLIGHVMETGQRRDADGKIVPRNIIHAFNATFDGRTVFEADLQAGISANPFLAFHLRVLAAGELVCTWVDDAGDKLVERIGIAIA